MTRKMGRVWAWIKRDGLLHIESCALIAVVAGLLLPWWISGLVALSAGIVKELWDIKNGVVSWHDVICDLAGALLGSSIVAIWSMLLA